MRWGIDPADPASGRLCEAPTGCLQALGDCRSQADPLCGCAWPLAAVAQAVSIGHHL